jgi:hypothetical protein
MVAGPVASATAAVVVARQVCTPMPLTPRRRPISWLLLVVVAQEVGTGQASAAMVAMLI